MRAPMHSQSIALGLLVGALSLIALTHTSRAQAAIDERQTCEDCEDTTKSALRRFFWNMDKANVEQFSTLANAKWKMSLSSPKADTKALSLEIQHAESGLVENGVSILEPNPAVFSQTFATVFRPAAGVLNLRTFGTATHEFPIPVFPPGNAPPQPPADQDVFFAEVTVPAVPQADASIALNGYHSNAPSTFYWELAPKRKGSVSVEASFADGTTKPFSGNIEVSQPNAPGSVIKPDAEGKFTAEEAHRYVAKLSPDAPPTDLKVKFAGSGQTDITLSFLENPDALYREADLTVATLALKQLQSVMVPLLFSETEHLHIGVDLSEWVLHALDELPAEPFHFSAGHSDQLPGFTVGWSEVVLSPGSGFSTSNPFNGELLAAGMVGGRAVPIALPPMLSLFLFMPLIMWRFQGSLLSKPHRARFLPAGVRREPFRVSVSGR